MIYTGNILGVTKMIYPKYMGYPMDIHQYKDMFGQTFELIIYLN